MAGFAAAALFAFLAAVTPSKLGTLFLLCMSDLGICFTQPMIFPTCIEVAKKYPGSMAGAQNTTNRWALSCPGFCSVMSRKSPVATIGQCSCWRSYSLSAPCCGLKSIRNGSLFQKTNRNSQKPSALRATEAKTLESPSWKVGGLLGLAADCAGDWNSIGHLNETVGCEPTQFVAKQFSGRGLR